MNQIEFTKHMDRLREQYGDKIYSAERMQGIWHSVRHLTEREWDRVVGDLISSSLQPPLLHKIRESCAPYAERIRVARDDEIKRLRASTSKCAQCGNTGTINAWEKGTIYSCVFRCSCRVAEMIGNNWPVWHGGMAEKYQPIFYVDEEASDGYRPPTREELNALAAPFASMPGTKPMDKRSRQWAVEESKRRAAGEFFEGGEAT